MISFSRLAILFCLLLVWGHHAGETAAPQTSRQQLIRILQSPAEPLDQRVAAVERLASLNPRPEAIFVKVMETSCRRLQRAIAQQLVRTRSGAEALLKSIEKGKASARLLQKRTIRDPLLRVMGGELKERLSKLTANLQEADEETESMIEQRRSGFLLAKTSLPRGKTHFKKHCAACHRVREDGGRIGPDLKAVGRQGLDRLLEDLLDPHRNVDPNFRRTTVVTTAGEILSGLLVRGKGTQRILIDQQGKEVILDEKEIDEAIVSPLSAMPTGLAGHLKAAEFYDLMAYLLALQGTQQPPQEPPKK